MHDILPGIARITFWVHLVVAVVLGLLMLFLPGQLAAWWGLEASPQVDLLIRALGSVILGIGAVTSYYGTRAPSWDHVDYIIRGEIVYLAVLSIVYLVALISGIADTPLHVVTFVVTLVLLVLFGLSFMRRPTHMT
jgi:hypothetical protein